MMTESERKRITEYLFGYSVKCERDARTRLPIHRDYWEERAKDSSRLAGVVTADAMSEPEWKPLWRGIIRLWQIAPHCLYHGCGQETLAQHYNACQTEPSNVRPRQLRRALNEAVRRGLMTRFTPDKRDPSHNKPCTAFRPTAKASLPPWRTVYKAYCKRVGITFTETP